MTPVDFIAKLTLHIPNRYQNVRRYAGFYSSNIQRIVRLAKPASSPDTATVEFKSPIKPKWATLIARVLGELLIACPRCGTAMDLKEFVFDVRWITKVIPELFRAPPKIPFAPTVAAVGLAYRPATNALAGRHSKRKAGKRE